MTTQETEGQETMTMYRAIAAAAPRQCGMTLIEILVAIVVLSIGLLGLAGLQVKGLQVNQGSTYRWQAAMLAEDMADRIRADAAGAAAGSYALAFGVMPASTGNAATDAAINEWLARVAALPSGQAQIAATAGGAANEMDIQVQWDDSRGINGVSSGNASSVTSGPQLRTFTLKAEPHD